MASTSAFGWETPDDTDLVKDGAAAIRTLGNSIDTSMSELKGGTTGQVLSKTTGTDMDFTWTDNPPTQGLPYVAGRYYGSSTAANKLTNQAFVANTTYYIPFFVRENRTFDRITLSSGSTFSGLASVRLGVYNNSGGVPTTVLLDAGLVAPAATNTNYEITISQALTPGYYWLAANTITAATTNNFNSLQQANATNPNDMGGSTPIIAQFHGYTESVNATSGFATAASLTASNGAIPNLTLRA